MTWNGDADAAGTHLAKHYFGDETNADTVRGEAPSTAG